MISTRQVADLLAVSEATVKRWADAGALRCMRTPGGHRKFHAEDVASFVRERGYTVAADAPAWGIATARPLTLVRPDAPTPDADAADAFRDLALAGDTDGLLALIARVRLGGRTLAEVFDVVAAHALVEIGQRWERGALTAAQEHLASMTVIEALARLRPMVDRAATPRGGVVVACPGEEQHDIAARMAALLACEAGYTTRLFGARVPATDLALQITAERPRWVILSAGPCAAAEPLARDLATIAEASRGAGARLVVGGEGFARLGERLRGTRRVADLRELAALVAEPTP